jgi:Kef-type K+ transport system membrane component KefB
MELGCFLAGLMFSMSESKMRHSTIKTSISTSTLKPDGHGHGLEAPNTMMHQLLLVVEPVKDLFLVIFFASVGMHVYPTFLATNALLLLVLTTIVLLLKWLAGICVFYLALQAVDRRTAHVLSVGLAQISEFAFVLASRGRRLGILSQVSLHPSRVRLSHAQ